MNPTHECTNGGWVERLRVYRTDCETRSSYSWLPAPTLCGSPGPATKPTRDYQHSVALQTLEPVPRVLSEPWDHTDRLITAHIDFVLSPKICHEGTSQAAEERNGRRMEVEDCQWWTCCLCTWGAGKSSSPVYQSVSVDGTEAIAACCLTHLMTVTTPPSLHNASRVLF